MSKSQYQIKSQCPNPNSNVGYLQLRFWISAQRRGFTLIETVMALGIFLIATTMVTSIFVSANKTSQRTVAQIRSDGDARWVFEKMTDAIRLATIDYRALRLDADGKTNFLPLLGSDGVAFAYGVPDTDTPCGAERMCLIFVPPGETEQVRMTGNAIQVRRISFYVWPIKDPFIAVAGNLERGQPRVTMVMETATIGTRKEEQAHLTLQTTVSTRVYKK